MTENTYDYKYNPIVKNIFLTMLIPTVLMNLTTALASFADTVIIGYFLDDLSLSVVTFATPIYMIINTFASLYAVGGSIAMSIDSGKGDKAHANTAFSVSIELLAFTGGILLLSGLLFSSQITNLLGAGPEVFDMVRTYATIILIGAPIFMLNIGLAFFVRNDGRPTLSMAGMFLSIAVNIVFDVIFIGFFHLGVAGAAYATVLGQLISVLVIASHFFSSKNTLKFCFTMNGMVFRIIRNGFSTALHFIYQFLSILILNHYVVSLAGTGGVVVYTVVFNLYTVSLALFEGLSQTVQPMISLYFGENSNKKIKNTLRLAVLTTLIICGTLTIILEIVPHIVPTIFDVDNPTLMAQSIVAVRIYATSMIIMTINVLVGYYLQSTENNFMSALLVSFRCCILFLGSAIILGKLIGMNGVWGAYTLAEVLTFLIFLVMVQAKRIQLLKKGIHADFYLLNQEIEKNIYCYTCTLSKDNFEDFKDYLLRQIQQYSVFEESVLMDMEQYLLQLSKCISNPQKEYIEVEINLKSKKIIIRDNLNHNALQENIQIAIQHGSKSEYGPVLGWNRICLE